MGKSKSTGSFTSASAKWESLPWSKVQVNKDTDADIEADELDDSKYLKAANHYDNPEANPSDLYDVKSSKGIDYLAGANDPGIFLGLEVIDGSQYSVEKIPIRNEITKQKTGGFVTKLIVKDAVAQSMKEEVELQKANQKKNASAKKLISVKDKTLPHDEQDAKTLSRKQRNRLKLEKIKEKRKDIKLQKKLKWEETEAANKTNEKTDGDSQKNTEVKDNVGLRKESKDLQKIKKKQKSKAEKDKQNLDAVPKEKMESTRVSWSIATGGVYLHPDICASLYRLGFAGPTPIQSSTLAASILGQRDVVGAAPTGSVSQFIFLRFYDYLTARSPSIMTTLISVVLSSSSRFLSFFVG
jgi:ATP-dependent RNA helicase DDX24/MAK5